MADPANPMIAIQEMLIGLTRDMASMKEEMTHMKTQISDKASASTGGPTFHQPPRVASPELNRPTISPLEVDMDDGQYAEEYCIPRINKEKEMYEKFEREMSKKFGKLAQEMEHMKVQGPKKFDVSELMMSSAVVLPHNFKVPDYDKYDGTGCPRNHVRWFIILSQQYGLNHEQMTQLFPISLIGIAKKWFLRLKPDEVRTMEDISDQLIEQFSMEEGIEVTKRDLKQRWRRKSAQLNQRLSEKDQIKLVVKSLSTQYFHFMAPQHYPNFDHLIQTGTQTEDAIGKGLRARPSSSEVREGKRPMVIQKEVNSVNYVRPVARAVTEVSRPAERQAPKQFDPLPYPYPVILKKLIRDKKIKLPDIRPVPDPLPKYWRLDQYCEYHRNSGHLTERCLALKYAIQKMIDNKDLEVERPSTTQNPLPNHRAIPPPVVNAIFVNEPLLDPSNLICAITSDKPYVLRLDDEEIEELAREKPYVLSLADDDFAESSSRSYILHCEDVEEEQRNKTPYVLRIEDDDLLFLDDQCDELQHVTRGGRVFKPPELSAENPAEIARAAGNPRLNRPVTEEEDDNLLKQLRKTQANISIWGLLMSSSKHRKVILKELNAAQVSIDVTPDELVSLVTPARTSKVLSFTDEDLPPEGKDHTKPLKITLICNKKKVPEVLVDNGSALNVCPLSTATTLGFGPENFVPSEQGILAYDGTRRDVIGTLVTEIQIGGEEFEIEFQVLDIKASFLLLLGRPWLHRVGVIPSTLHQKLKFVRNNRVVTVKGDPDLEIGQISQELVVGKADDISLTGFSLEVTAITMEEAMNEEIFFLSSTNSKVVKIIRKQGYMPGAGLGKYHQGMIEFPMLKTFNGLFGLGYEPTKKEIIEMKRYMLKWAECRRRGLDLPMGPLNLTMNGHFRKEGADVPFCGFAEAWVDESTGQRLPGFEIFFDLELPKNELVSVQIAEIESETDWADCMVPEFLNSLFEDGSQMVAVIDKSTVILNPAHLITSAEGPLTNWTSQVLPQVIFQYGTVEVKSTLGVDDVSLASEVEFEDIFTDVLDASHVHISEYVDTDVNMSVSKFVNTIPESVKPDVGYSSSDKSIKGRVIAEQLADSPTEENVFLKTEFPDEEIMDIEEETPSTKWLMYFDGAVNNQEYEACIAGLEAALALQVQDIDVFGDSMLIICQTNGQWKTREDKLIPYNAYLESLVKKFKNITFTHLSRTRNHFADALATLASMLDISATMEVQPLAVRLQWAPAHVNAIEILARCPDGKPWYTDIKNFISGKGHPPDASSKERKTLQRLATNFIICGEELYRRSFDGIQLLCVDEDKAVELIEQTHEGMFI
ncbi:uncharacterized protein LOC143891172 [Tasmannia lanceolata]|uniref:uncharacterized protein LOC143891172 n=1 Tax=Tasmannia lanceolata TaxID=3420 RepID=UPI004063046A